MTKKLKIKTKPQNKISSKIISTQDIGIKSTLTMPKVDETRPSISLKYIDMNFKTFNDLKEQKNLRKFDNFIKKVNNNIEWEPIFKLHDKTPTNPKKQFKDRLKKLNMDIEQLDLFHLRLSNKFRVHGFRKKNRFKLIWLDPNHEVNKT